jgi:hypothetical protein
MGERRTRLRTLKAERMLERTAAQKAATAERAVVPRTGASNDGETEADARRRSASDTGVASAT